MFDKVRRNHDLELIFLYTKSMFDTIIKLICIKTLIALEAICPENQSIQLNRELPYDMIETFEKIDSVILQGRY